MSVDRLVVPSFSSHLPDLITSGRHDFTQLSGFYDNSLQHWFITITVTDSHIAQNICSHLRHFHLIKKNTRCHVEHGNVSVFVWISISALPRSVWQRLTLALTENSKGFPLLLTLQLDFMNTTTLPISVFTLFMF